MSTACPNCDSGDTVIYVQDARDGLTKRTRFCRDCHNEFRTVEVVAASLPNLVNDDGVIRERWATHIRPAVRLPLFGGLVP